MNTTMHRGAISSYHAHIYYDATTKHIATQLRNEFVAYLKREIEFGILDSDDIVIGAMHDGPVGPHTKSQFMVAFTRHTFHSLLNHLILSRNGLSVLVHPETGNDYKDHTDYTLWMGNRVALDLSKL